MFQIEETEQSKVAVPNTFAIYGGSQCILVAARWVITDYVPWWVIRLCPLVGHHRLCPLVGYHRFCPLEGYQIISPGGSWQIMSPDRSSQIMCPCGSSQIRSPDGSLQIMPPGGSPQIRSPGGSPQVMSSAFLYRYMLDTHRLYNTIQFYQCI